MSTNNKELVIICLIILLMLGCHSKNKPLENKFLPLSDNYLSVNKNNSAEVKLRLNTDKPFPIETLFDSITIVPLKTETLIGKIDQIKVVNKNIFISDKKTLFCFNNKMEEQFTVKSKGRGPKEFSSIHNFFIDSAKTKISVFDYQLRKIVTLNISDGSFVSETNYEPPIPTVNFTHLSTGKYIHSTQNMNFDMNQMQYSVFVSNKKGEIISRNIPIQDNWNNLIFSPFDFTENSSQNLIYACANNRKIYEIKSNERIIDEKYQVDFGKHNFEINELNLSNHTSQSITNNSEILSQHLTKNKLILGPVCAMETDSIIIIGSIYKRDLIRAIYSKKTGNNVFYENYIHHYTTKGMFKEFPFCTWKDYFVYVVYPYRVLEELEKIEAKLGEQEFKDFLKKNKHFLKIKKDYEKLDNPLLMFVKYKAF